MRHWLFHPLIFYPVLAVAAVLLTLVSLRPDIGPLPAPAAAGGVTNGAVVLAGGALAHPDVGPGQVAHVVRDGLGRAIGLRIAVVPDQPAPGPADLGVRLLLTPDAAAAIAGRRASIEVSLRPVEVTTAPALAVSLQGAGPVSWEQKDIVPGAQTVRFSAPANGAPIAVGLRAISGNNEYNYGFEIVRVRILPAGAA